MSTELTRGNGQGDAGHSWPPHIIGNGQSPNRYYGNGDFEHHGDGIGSISNTPTPLSPALTRSPTFIGLIAEYHSDLQTSVMLTTLNVRRYRGNNAAD